MKKTVLTLVLLVALLVALTGCGKVYYVKNTKNTETKKVETRDFDQSRIDEFYTQWYLMESHTNEILEGFVDNGFAVTQEFLNDIYSVEEEYATLLEYVSTLTVEEYQYFDPYSEEHTASIQDYLENGWVKEPIMEVNYDDSRIEGEDSWMYLNGNIVLAKDYYVYVEDIKNINTTSKPSDYEKVREYTIVDPKKDAYMVLSGELGYQVIRIIGKQ